MLVLSRKLGEQLVVDENIVVQVLGISGKRVQLGIDAPAGKRVLRKELAMREEAVEATARTSTPRDTTDSGPQSHAGTASCLPRGWAGVQDRRKRVGPGHVVLAEDDDEMRAMLTESLHAEGYEVTECRDGMQLVGLLWDGTNGQVRRGVDLVISDIRMPGVLGLSVLAGVRSSGAGVPVILITAFGDEATHAEAYRLGAAAILDKPFEVDDLLRTAREVLDEGHPLGTSDPQCQPSGG